MNILSAFEKLFMVFMHLHISATLYQIHGCALRKNKGNPVQKNCEIHGALRTIFMKKKNDDYLDAQEQGKMPWVTGRCYSTALDVI